MKNRYLFLALPLTVLLVAAAFYLPDQLSRWMDQSLLDTPQITEMDGDRQGFAASIRLTLPEKLMLLRSRKLTPVEVPEEEQEIRLTIGADGEIYFSQEPSLREEKGAEGRHDPEKVVGAEAEERAKLVSQRLTAVQSELLILQKMGAMPQLWPKDSAVELVNYREILYIEAETQVTFPVYYMELDRAPYRLNLTVDAQTGKILSFDLRWPREAALSWNSREAGPDFGHAWRDYWGMDRVDETMLASKYLSDVLLGVEIESGNSSHIANTNIEYAYNGQSVRIPLNSWNINDNVGSSIQWNC